MSEDQQDYEAGVDYPPMAIPGLPTNEIAAALAKAQAMMEPAKKDSENPHFKSKYADMSSVVTALRQALASNGIAYYQAVRYFDGEPRLVTRLLHSSGQWLEDDGVPLWCDKRSMQALGSALTYARRYGLQAASGVAPADDDDGEGAGREGNGATDKKKPPPGITKMREQLRAFCVEVRSCDDEDQLDLLLKTEDAHLAWANAAQIDGGEDSLREEIRKQRERIRTAPALGGDAEAAYEASVPE